MNLGELMEEFFGRGFDDLRNNATEEARVIRWANYAQREVCEEQPWPFLETTKEGTAPQTINDLGHVLNVVDVTNKNQLRYADRRQLVAIDPTLSSSGAAERWYMEGATSLKVYPSSTSSFLTRYVKAVPDLSEPTDEPVVPSNYQELIIEGMVIRGYKNRDAWEAASAARAEWKLGMERMVRNLIKRNFDTDRTIMRTGRPGDYIN